MMKDLERGQGRRGAFLDLALHLDASVQGTAGAPRSRLDFVKARRRGQAAS